MNLSISISEKDTICNRIDCAVSHKRLHVFWLLEKSVSVKAYTLVFLRVTAAQYSAECCTANVSSLSTLIKLDCSVIIDQI